MFRKILRQVIELFAAAALALLVVSALCFCIYRPTGWLEREKNACSSIWEPNSTIVYGMEGYGILQVDKNGYINSNAEPDDEIVLCMGSSYTQGKEVGDGFRYTDILNEKLAQGEKLAVYNLSRDAWFYPEIVKGFEAALAEFPQTKTVVIEIGNTEFAVEDLQSALIQREFSKDACGEALYESLPTMQKLKMKIKDYVPLISVLGYQKSQKTKAPAVTQEEVKDKKSADDTYVSALEKTMELMRNSFSGNIIILYHPSVSLNKTGEMEIVHSAYLEEFESCCEKYEISFVNMEDSFLQSYEQRHVLPYGFSNTQMGVGHLNKEGHAMVAQKVYACITGGEYE